MMKRRTLLGAGALWVVSRALCAQSARKVFRIGILGAGTTADMVGPQPRSATIKAFLRGMRELGYVYGEHFVTEPRGAESQPERYPALAAELVRAQVDVIVAAGPTLAALKQATATLPIVMAASGDPVGEGLVQSLGHPGTNFTGLSSQSVEVTGKRLELLKQIATSEGPVAVLCHRTVLSQWQAAEVAAREQNLKLMSL